MQVTCRESSLSRSCRAVWHFPVQAATHHLVCLSRFSLVNKTWCEAATAVATQQGDWCLIPDDMPAAALEAPLVRSWALTWKHIQLNVSAPVLELPAFQAFLVHISAAVTDLHVIGPSSALAPIGPTWVQLAVLRLDRIDELKFVYQLPSFPFPPRLKVLMVESVVYKNHELEHLVASLSGCPHLQELDLLDLTGNVVLQYPSSIAQLSSLRVIELEMNDIGTGLNLSALSSARSFALFVLLGCRGSRGPLWSAEALAILQRISGVLKPGDELYLRFRDVPEHQLHDLLDTVRLTGCALDLGPAAYWT